jgi:virulence-associated protein VapD
MPRAAAAPAFHPGLGHNSSKPGGGRVYAIAFDMDTTALQDAYHNSSWQNAYNDIGKTLAKYGFNRKQGSVYFGDESVAATSCFLAVQDLTRSFPWFAPCVSDIRMLRIEETNDLRPIVDAALPSGGV